MCTNPCERTRSSFPRRRLQPEERSRAPSLLQQQPAHALQQSIARKGNKPRKRINLQQGIGAGGKERISGSAIDTGGHSNSSKEGRTCTPHLNNKRQARQSKARDCTERRTTRRLQAQRGQNNRRAGIATDASKKPTCSLQRAAGAERASRGAERATATASKKATCWNLNAIARCANAGPLTTIAPAAS